MNFSTLLVEEFDGYTVLTLNRPNALNALNQKLLSELKDFVLSFKDSKQRALIVTGSGEKAFVAGADIKEMQELTPDQAHEMSLNGQETFQMLQDLPQVVIGAVNGFALGGGFELALACDFLIASEKAKFGLPEVSLGLIPGYGGTQRLSRVVGLKNASYLALTGEMIKADKAYNLGIVTEVCEPTQLGDRAAELAKLVCSRGPVAVGLAKQAIYEGYSKALPEALAFEADIFRRTFATKDHQEGITAFIEKRAPNFKGE